MKLFVTPASGPVRKVRITINELGIEDSVEFLGFRSDVETLLCSASILIAPTPREGLGISVLEAMACGLPIVASRGGGHLETVGSVEGAALFDDCHSAAKQLSALMADPDRRAEYGRALRGRQREAFRVHSQTSRTIHVLCSAAAKSPRR